METEVITAKKVKRTPQDCILCAIGFTLVNYHVIEIWRS